MKFFITGTDTGIGKTTVSVALLHYFNDKGYRTLGIKPLATGGFLHHHHLYNEDALALQRASSVKMTYQDHNPIVFEPPIAPHFAARQVKQKLSVQRLLEATARTRQYPADLTLVEGVGGWLVPLNAKETMADFVVQSQLPVILVVGIRLGCLNHALLTYQALQQSKVTTIGWIAKGMAKDSLIKPMIHTLKAWMDIPLIGYLPWSRKEPSMRWSSIEIRYFI